MEGIGSIIWLVIMGLIVWGTNRAKQLAAQQKRQQQPGTARAVPPQAPKAEGVQQALNLDELTQSASPRPASYDYRFSSSEASQDAPEAKLHSRQPAPIGPKRALTNTGAERRTGSIIPQISDSPTVQAIVAQVVLDRPQAAKLRNGRR